MSNRRLTQHRQQRDTSNQETSELKKEVKALKRQLARAHREIDRLQGVQESEPLVVGNLSPACPKCLSTQLGEIKTPNGKTVTSCKTCKKWRSRAV